MTTDEWLQIAEDDAKVWANSCPRHVRILVGELRRSRQILRDVRPMLCDILKLMSEFGAGNDYEAVAKVVDQIDTALGEIQPAPLDAPDAPVNPDCTIRGVK